MAIQRAKCRFVFLGVRFEDGKGTVGVAVELEKVDGVGTKIEVNCPSGIVDVYSVGAEASLSSIPVSGPICPPNSQVRSA